MNDCIIRPAGAGDEAGAYYVCLKTGDYGKDGAPFYDGDPDALGRILVGPYLAGEPDCSFVLEDAGGICGYVLGAPDSQTFYARYEAEWRPRLCARFLAPSGDPANWTRVQQVYHSYHHPDYFMPEPRKTHPSHLRIDLLERAQGRGYGRRLLEQIMEELRRHGSPGAHVGVSVRNLAALGFFRHMGFEELMRTGDAADGCINLGRRFLGREPPSHLLNP